MTPFAQNAQMMYVEVMKLSVPFPYRELRPYLDVPELAEGKAVWSPTVQSWKDLVIYSNQLVALNGAKKSEREKNELLAQFILQARQRDMNRGTLETSGLNIIGLDTVLAQIRSAPTFLEGINAAAPLVSSVVSGVAERIDSAAGIIPYIVAAFDRRIEADQADQKRNLLALRSLHARFQLALTHLYRAKLEEAGALDSLLTVDPSMKEYLTTAQGQSPMNLQQAEDALTARLERLHEAMSQLIVEAQLYRAKKQELLDWSVEYNRRVKIARDGLMLWAQSHYNLGQGVAVPPLIDVASMASGLAKTLLPMP